MNQPRQSPETARNRAALATAAGLAGLAGLRKITTTTVKP